MCPTFTSRVPSDKQLEHLQSYTVYSNELVKLEPSLLIDILNVSERVCLHWSLDGLLEPLSGSGGRRHCTLFSPNLLPMLSLMSEALFCNSKQNVSTPYVSCIDVAEYNLAVQSKMGLCCLNWSDLVGPISSHDDSKGQKSRSQRM